MAHLSMMDILTCIAGETLRAAGPANADWLVATLAVVGAGMLSLALWLAHVANLRIQDLESANRERQREATARTAAEARLAETRDHLELRVLERTADLAKTVGALQAEILNRMRVEETLRASQERYRDLFDSASDCVFTTDLKGNFTSVNRTGLALFDYTLEQALQMSAFQLVVPEHRDLVRSMTEKKLRGQRGTTFEADMLTKDGRRLTLEFNTRLLFENGLPVGIQGIARDVTDRRALEEQLRQSQKMEAIGQLAGGVAHDFNNLLTIIWSYGQMVLDEAPAGNAVADYATEILMATERASALTNRLLTFSRRQVVQARLLDLNAVILGLEKMLRRLVGADIEIETALAPEVCTVKADPAQIEQVLLNLVVNAQDAMPDGGRIRIETAGRFCNGEMHPAERCTPHRVIDLTVSDTGHGMDEDVRRRLFEPFFTTKAPGKGTGLGLSIVYGIVRQSGGQITVDSAAGQGATFRVCLPAAEGAIAPTRQAAGATAGLEGRGETVLIAEDEAEVRQLVTRLLSHSGYRVLEGSDGVEALQAVDKHDGAIDLLLTDMVMPRMNGRELAERLTATRPGTRVLYMTGYTDDQAVRQGIERAQVAVLQKPFRPEALLQAVRAMLDDRNYGAAAGAE